MSDNIEKTPEARWRHLKEVGSKKLINLQTNELIGDKPKWLDEEKFAKAKETIQKFYIGVSYSSFTGLLLILQLPDGLEPLLSTGNSKDIPSLYKRYLSTITHVNSWYEDDVFNPETKGYKSIRQVRAMHKRVQVIMNDKFKVTDVDGKPRLWFTQYDVAMTQWAFVGLAMLFPAKSALIAAKHEDLELINYYWRVLGYLMGIEDEFNSCQFDNYDDIYQFNKLLFEHEYQENFKKLPCEKGLEMTKSICLALHYFLPLLTFNNLAHWWQDCFLFNGYQPQAKTTKEKLLDFWQRLSFNHLLKNESFLVYSTRLHKKRFQTRLQNKDKVYEKLKAQFIDNTQHSYFSDRVDYFEQKKESLPNSKDVECNNNNNENDDLQAIKSCPFGYGASTNQTVDKEANLVSA